MQDFAVINGRDVCILAHLPGFSGATELVLVNRADRRVKRLPTIAPSGASVDQSVAAGGELSCVLGVDSTGTWDVAALDSGRRPVRLPLMRESGIYPAPPVAPHVGADGVLVVPYRTRDDRAALQVTRLSRLVDVATIVSEPGRLAFGLELRSWEGAPPTTFLLEQRGGAGRVTVPLDIRTGFGSVTVPLEEVAGQCVDAPTSVWNVSLDGIDGAVRCGRTTRDVSDPRRVYRYATSTFESREPHGARVIFRPYFTRDRYLAVEIDCSRPVGLSS